MQIPHEFKPGFIDRRVEPMPHLSIESRPIQPPLGLCTSAKFWEVAVNGCDVSVRFGRMRRKDDLKDKILQGHHRLSIAIELDLPTVPVRIVY